MLLLCGVVYEKFPIGSWQLAVWQFGQCDTRENSSPKPWKLSCGLFARLLLWTSRGTTWTSPQARQASGVSALRNLPVGELPVPPSLGIA